MYPIEMLKNEKEIFPCPYRIDDKILFKPNISKKDEEYLMPFFPFKYEIENKECIIISKIVNDMYLVVKNKKSELFTFPLLWTDFEKM